MTLLQTQWNERPGALETAQTERLATLHAQVSAFIRESIATPLRMTDPHAWMRVKVTGRAPDCNLRPREGRPEAHPGEAFLHIESRGCRRRSPAGPARPLIPKGLAGRGDPNQSRACRLTHSSNLGVPRGLTRVLGRTIDGLSFTVPGCLQEQRGVPHCWRSFRKCQVFESRVRTVGQPRCCPG